MFDQELAQDGHLRIARTHRQGDTTIHDLHLPLDLPCYTILVHGVNDLGEAYPNQERGLCEGLNERLGWQDAEHLEAAPYRLPPARGGVDQEELSTLQDDPDAIYYRRKPASGTNSPMIPFYWGYRAGEGLQRDTPHGQWLDAFGNRIDKNGAKEGGPFANATNNLVDFWSDGFKRKTHSMGVDLNERAKEPDHPLLDAPDRRYFLLASARLAMIIRMIRARNPHAAINVIGHSQGTLLILMAHAILAGNGERGADTAILNNSPYGFGKSKVDAASRGGGSLQTPWAKAQTFTNLVQAMTKHPSATPAFPQLLNREQSPFLTGPGRDAVYADRDNRGKVYNYFCPEDHTTGMHTIQGFGFQGVQDDLPVKKIKDGGGTAKITLPLASSLKPRFHQRVWTMRPRDGKPVPVGEGSRFVLHAAHEDFWGFSRTASIVLHHTPEQGETRSLSADPLPKPFLPDLHFGETGGVAPRDGKTQGFLAVSPSDAATAATNEGTFRTRQYKNGSTSELGTRTILLENDPRTGLEKQQDERSGRFWNLERHLFEDRPDSQDWHEVLRVDKELPNQLLVHLSPETYRQARLRWQTKEHDVNSYHSAIVANPEHTRRVTAWDVCFGLTGLRPDQMPPESVKTPAHGRAVRVELQDPDTGEWYNPAWRHVCNQRFVDWLCYAADWRKKTEVFRKDIKDPERAHFHAQEPEDHKKLLKATADYYDTGVLPESLLPTLKSLSALIVSQTESELSAVEAREVLSGLC